MKTSLESISQSQFASSSILILFMKKAHDQLLFFKRKDNYIPKTLLWSRNEENILLLNHVRLLCHALHSKFIFLNPFRGLKKPMNNILKIWRYITIGVIMSLLTLSIFILGCTTDSIPKKNKKSTVMNDPIVTYWYCWWRINRYCTDSSGFKLLCR